MRSTSLLFPLVLAACGGSARQPVAAPQNTAPEHTAAAGSPALGCDGAMQAGFGGVHGITMSKADGTTLIGVTLVATSPALQGEQTALSDEHGCYFFSLPPGDYRITAYYSDVAVEQQATVKDGVLGNTPVVVDLSNVGETVKINAD